MEIDIKDLIGKKCSHLIDYLQQEYESDRIEWNDKNTIECVIEDVIFDIEDKFPFTLNVGIKLWPVDPKHQRELSDDFFDPVPVDSIHF